MTHRDYVGQVRSFIIFAMFRGGNTRRRQVRLRLALAVVGSLVFGAVTLLFAGRALVVSRPLSDPDVIVSLASHEWERLPLTAKLALEHPRALVLITLPQVVTTYTCHDCDHRIDRLVAAGVDANRIRVLSVATVGTHGEAEACRDFVATMPIGNLLIVTSPYHTRRALAVFRDVLSPLGTQIGVEPATAFSSVRPDRWWLSPNDRWYVRYEWAATAYYVLRYNVVPIVR